MSCIDDIVSLGLCNDENTSGFTLLSAPGISPLILADIANETYTGGIKMALEKKRISILQVKNDFIGALQVNNVIAKTQVIEYESGSINLAQSTSTYSGFRGLTIHKKNKRGGLSKVYIKEIQVYPLATGTAIFQLIDGDRTISYTVELIANQLNTIDIEESMVNSSVQVVMNQTSIPLASSKITCHTGCNGIPNDCAWVEGWNGTSRVKDNGFGIKIVFYCKCDYEQIICDTQYMGEIIWLKWQLNVMEEAYLTNRFNYMTIYKRGELPTVIDGLRQQYTDKWNELMAGLWGILNSYKDSCLDCRGVRKVLVI